MSKKKSNSIIMGLVEVGAGAFVGTLVNFGVNKFAPDSVKEKGLVKGGVKIGAGAGIAYAGGKAGLPIAGLSAGGALVAFGVNDALLDEKTGILTAKKPVYPVANSTKPPLPVAPNTEAGMLSGDVVEDEAGRKLLHVAGDQTETLFDENGNPVAMNVPGGQTYAVANGIAYPVSGDDEDDDSLSGEDDEDDYLSGDDDDDEF